MVYIKNKLLYIYIFYVLSTCFFHTDDYSNCNANITRNCLFITPKLLNAFMCINFKRAQLINLRITILDNLSLLLNYLKVELSKIFIFIFVF